MIIQPINYISKEYITGYENTVFHSTLEEYQQSDSGIYIDYDNNLVKFKNTKTANKYCWLQFALPSLNQFDEFYTEYEIRKCKGEPLKLTYEKQHIYRQNAYANVKTEWEKHCSKVIIEHNETGTEKALVGFGNTMNVEFECEIRNIKIKMVSNKEDNFSLVLKNKKKIEDKIPLRASYNFEKNYFFYVGKIKNINNWGSFVFFLLSNYLTEIHNISSWDGETLYSISHLTRYDKNKHFKVFKKEVNSEIEFYIQANRALAINDFYFFSTNENFIVNYPFERLSSLPIGAIEIIPTEYSTTVVSSIYKLHTPYMATKMQQEGVYNDYITYMDEKTAYDKQQEKLEEQKQLAYEQALKENPKLTYEEFMSVQPMTLNLVEEPQPSENLKKFMDKYL